MSLIVLRPAAPWKGPTVEERSPAPRFRGYVKVDPKIHPPTSAVPPDPQPADPQPADPQALDADPAKDEPVWRRWLNRTP